MGAGDDRLFYASGNLGASLGYSASRSDGQAVTSMTRIKDRYGQMAKGRMASLELRQKRARARATELAPVIAELQAPA
jgi:hypothetical protein